MAAAPKLRQDLQVRPLQDEGGVVYYDVGDPRTGGVLRLYDFEWLVAERLDGQRSFEELSAWARAELGLEASPEDLAVYAQRLAELGLFDLLARDLPIPGAPSGKAPREPSGRAVVEPPPEVPASRATPVPAVPERSGPAAAAEPQDAAAAPSEPLLASGGRGGPGADDVMGAPVVPLPDGGRAIERKSTLLMPTVVSQEAAAQAATRAPAVEEPRPPSSISERPTAPMQTIEAPASEPAYRVTLPEAQAAPVRPVEAERPLSDVDTEPAPRIGGELPIDTASGELSVPQPAGPSPAESAAGARGEAAEPEDELDEVDRGGVGRWIALIVLLLALGLLAYLLFGLQQPPAIGVHVRRAQPREVTRTLGASAVVKRAAPQVLRMEGGGVLASVVGEGAEVSAGMSLAVLQSHAKLQKEITDLRERLVYYQRRREVATDKGDESAAREAAQKVSEKEARLQNAEAALKKAQILASRSGKVTRVLVHAGDLVSPGSEIIEIADRFLSAEVTLEASEAQGLKVGEEAQLEGPQGPLSARITGLQPQGDKVLVQLELPDESSVKAGDTLRMVRGRLSNVELLPSPAVIEGDTVFIVRQGRAQKRRVTVLEHRGGDVLVSGLVSGEEVVIGNAGELRDGQLVKPLYGP